MKWWPIAAAGGGLVLVGGAAAVVIPKWATSSSTASRLGLDNTPTDPEHLSNLQFLMRQTPVLLSIVQTVNPKARFTSAYRSPEVNAAVGGVPTSRHALGLGLDIGGFNRDNLLLKTAVATIWRNQGQLPPLHEAIAELDNLNHVHIGFRGPSEAPREHVKWLIKRPSPTRYETFTPTAMGALA